MSKIIIKTACNIKKSLFDKISAVASEHDVSKSFVINSVIRKAIAYNKHKTRFLERVSYQMRITDESDSWHCMPVSLEPDVYEKCLDVRKLSKVSVSLFVSAACVKFLEQVIDELESGNTGDNYTANYLQFYTQVGHYNQITLLWEMVETEKLQKIYEIHRE